MSILLMSGMAWAAIAIAAVILIVVVVGAIKNRYPEKQRKPLKKV